MVEKGNLAQKFNLFHEAWHPKIVGELNDSYVKLAKIKGEFIWHRHENEDELFLVFKGCLLMRLREGDLRVGEGEFVIIPRGVEHCPVGEEEVQVVLIEPRTTINTGNVNSDRTIGDEWI